MYETQTKCTICEFEDESIAYVVGKHFGLDGLASPNYLCLHEATAELIMGCQERIRNISAEIIQALETEAIPVF